MMTESMLQELAAHGETWCLDVHALARFTARNPRAERAADGRTSRMPRANGTVAVIPVHGVLTKRGLWGDGGLDDIGRTLAAAMSNSNFSGVVLDVDSPGGSTYGLPEFADDVYRYRNAGKPLVSIANSVAASAALWGPSSSPTFVASPSSDVGSLGVWSLHMDYSRLLSDVGIKPTFIFAGKHKVDGNPFEPLSDDAKAHWQASVDDTYKQFLSAMGRNRGVSPAKARDDFGQGRMLSATEAKAVGLVDRVDTLEGVLAKMRATDAVETRSASETELTQWLCNVWTSREGQRSQPHRHVDAARAKRIRERKSPADRSGQISRATVPAG